MKRAARESAPRPARQTVAFTNEEQRWPSRPAHAPGAGSMCAMRRDVSRERCIMSKPRGKGAGLTDKTGRVFLSHNHLALLHGLYDRPDGVAPSTDDWIRASQPYLELFSSNPSDWQLRKSISTLHASWIEHARVGNQHR